MPTFVEGGSTSTPFGRNEYLRSTNPRPRTESYMFAAATLPVRTIDGVAGQKILQAGVVLAKITSGDESGKVGPFQGGTAGAAAVNEQQTISLGAASAGTVTISFDGETTAAIAFDATATTIRNALLATSAFKTGDVTVAGGPWPALVTLTFAGQYAGTDVAEVTVTPSGLTGGTVTVATTVPGSAAAAQVAAATDGRGDLANIVGLNDTFLPWQLMERDVEVAAVYEAAAVQAWCLEYTSDAAQAVPGALSNRTAAAMQRGGAAGKMVDITFSDRS